MKFKSNNREIKSKMKKANETMLKAVGIAGVAHVKQVIQSQDIIDSGDLLGSIDSQSDDKEVYVGSNLTSEVYPIYVHEGTSSMTGRPFLTNGIMNNLGNLRTVARKNYKL